MAKKAKNDERVVLEVRADGSLRTMTKKQTAAWQRENKTVIRDEAASPEPPTGEKR